MLPGVDLKWPANGGEDLEGVLEKFALPPSAQTSFTARLEALTGLSNAILAGDAGLRAAVPVEGLAFLSAFLREDNLRSLLGREVADLRALEQFTRIGSRKSLRVVPRGLVCHWVAGNVPLLAVFSWAISAALGNRNVLRLSSRQGDVMSPLLAAVACAGEAGREMAEETLVVSFDRENTAAHESLSRLADARIAWGGREAVDAIRDLPADWDCQDIVFGPRASMAVIDPAQISASAIGRLATDAAVFDQLACSSPQCIFVRGAVGDAGFDEFVSDYSQAFAQQSASFVRHDLDFAETFQISLDRARAVLDGGRLRRDAETQWTVAVLNEPNDNIECSNRFVQIIPYADLSEIYSHIPRNVQTCILQLASADAEKFSEAAAHFGVCRFPAPGEGNHFENPWDGVGLVSRLTRTVMRTEAANKR